MTLFSLLVTQLYYPQTNKNVAFRKICKNTTPDKLKWIFEEMEGQYEVRCTTVNVYWGEAVRWGHP